MNEVLRDMSDKSQNIDALAPLWTGAEAARLTGGRLIGPQWQATGLALDSREVRGGELFFALPGEQDHGERHISKAIEAGAVAAVTTDVSGALPDGASLLFVDNVEEALLVLAREARARMEGAVVAVTGSSGKTTTREMIAASGGSIGVCHQSPASYNNFRGVPFALASMPEDTDIGVFEIGMNHAGEITPLTKLVAPDCAVITTIGDAHIGHLGSRKAIADAKAEIFLGLIGRKLCILPGDDALFPRLSDLAKAAGCSEILRFGESQPGFEARLLGVQQTLGGSDQLPSSTIRAEIFGKSVTWTLPVAGIHMACNSLAALLCIAALSGNPDRESLAAAAARLSRLNLQKGRGVAERLTLSSGGDLVLIDDSYNANPQSVRAALQVLRSAYQSVQPARRIAILGDMLELGSAAERLHLELLGDLTQQGIDRVYGCGPLMANLMSSLPEKLYGGWAPSSDRLIPLLIPEIANGDILLVKGSLGMSMAKIVTAVRSLTTADANHSPDDNSHL